MSSSTTPAASPGPQVTRNVTLKGPFTRKTDVFDSDDFEPIKFINQIYPDGEVLRSQLELLRPQPAAACMLIL
jgi:hypothetical protein